ncbi:hypothetical protein TRFO_36798 [Tritrichomonas foetus]|uniref:Uncharacterized protein n=1 Tax=Tritrichomonas foetus TaxID=1144522 RepID=A0A1J4JD29_9EUKA|nr:hypothetical protein TRFO_36798 [Tritrichomonas foetus]|eukprot:OHS97024.1 hypothetical protein TRFO_36798 [Tritrichomonas foetus]
MIDKMNDETPFFYATSSVCRESQSTSTIRQNSEARIKDFMKSITNDLNVLLPLCEDDPERFDGEITFEKISSLLGTFDSSLELLSTIVESSTRKPKSVTSPIFAKLFSNYMKLSADLLSHDVFPNNIIGPFIGVYSSLERIYVDILLNPKSTVSVQAFRTSWNRHFRVFVNYPKLIRFFDFPTLSQKLENVYQYIISAIPDDNIQQTNDLTYLFKSIKEKLPKIDEKSSTSEISQVAEDLSAFREIVQIVEQNNPYSNLNSRVFVLSLISTNLQISKSIMEFKDYLLRVNDFINCENLEIDPSDFTSPDSKVTAFIHLAETAALELRYLMSNDKPSISFARKAASSLFHSLKTLNITALAQKIDRFIELISNLAPQIEDEYETMFISNMSNIRAPDEVFENLKTVMKKNPTSIEDYCERLASFLNFEEAAQLHESNDTTKFKEYLIFNIIQTKMQEVVVLFDEHMPRVEGKIQKLGDDYKSLKLSSYCSSIVTLLNKMKANHLIMKESEVFAENFTIFIEFLEYNFIKKPIQFTDHCQFLPPPELIKKVFFNRKEIHNVKILVAKIQKSILNVADYVQSNPNPLHLERSVMTRQIDLLEICEEYIRQLFVILNNFKITSRFFLMYDKFVELNGISPPFKITQRQQSKLSPILAKNVPLFARSMLTLIKSNFMGEKFTQMTYSSVLLFLKYIFMNEEIDYVSGFGLILDSIPFIDFTKSVYLFFTHLDNIEAILYMYRKSFNLSETISYFYDIWNSITKLFISFESENTFYLEKDSTFPININDFNQKSDKFLTNLINISPQLYAEVVKIYPSVINFINQLFTLKTFGNASAELVKFYSLPRMRCIFGFNEVIFLNFVNATVKAFKKACKSDFVDSDSLNAFLLLDNSIGQIVASSYEKISRIQYVARAFNSFKNAWKGINFVQLSQPIISNLMSIVSSVDGDLKSMKRLIKLSEMVKNHEKTDQENQNHFENNFVMILKFQHILKKIKHTTALSQCQFIEVYHSLETLVDAEIRSLHANKLFLLSYYLFFEKVKNSSNHLKVFNNVNPRKSLTVANPNFKMQIPEILMESETMINNINNLVGNCRWMHGVTRDNFVKMVSLSESIDFELKNTFKKIYTKLSAMEDQNANIIENVNAMMQKCLRLHRVLTYQEDEIMAKKREYIRTRNVMTYKYSLTAKKLETLRSSNMQKRIKLQKLKAKLALKHEFEDDEKIKKHSKTIKVIPFKPSAILPTIDSVPVEIDVANKILKEALIENERLKALMNSKIAQFQNTNSSKSAAFKTTSPSSRVSSNISLFDKDIPNNVVDQYFGKIALVKSAVDNQENPISSDVNVDKVNKSLLKVINEFRRNSRDSRQDYIDTSKILLRKLDKMIGVYRIQKERTSKIRDLIRSAKVTKEDYKSVVAKLLENENI